MGSLLRLHGTWFLAGQRPAAVTVALASAEHSATVTSSARVPDSIRRTGRVQWRWRQWSDGGIRRGVAVLRSPASAVAVALTRPWVPTVWDRQQQSDRPLGSRSS